MQSQQETKPAKRMPTDEEISDILIVISFIAKRLASLITKKGETK